jgi:hypothetical protein
MTVRLLHARKLAEELGQGRVSPRTKAYYLCAGFALWTVINVTGFTTVSPLWSWMSLIEAIALIVITLLGVQSAYDAAGGDDNPEFIAEFTCLYVPVSLTSALLVWGAYWGIVAGFRESLIAISESRMQFAINLGQIGSSVFGALVTLAVLAFQALTFYRITRLFQVVRSQPRSVAAGPYVAPAPANE